MYPNLPSGSNILGVYPGSKWGSPDDEIIILAAHWDTMEHTDGYNDNGSGVAAILTISQILAEKKCKLSNSVIFAAFDLEEVGEQGSLEFVQRFLIPEVMAKFGQKKIKGAYVIDTIMNYNTTEGKIKTKWLRDKVPKPQSEGHEIASRLWGLSFWSVSCPIKYL